MTEGDLDRRVAAVAALGDPMRRALYRFVTAQEGPVSRDEAAAAVAAPRSTAAFHLDRLVDQGLLEAEFRRLGGRRGPGAGRPSKLYRPSPGEITVTLPARHYDLAADLLASAVTESGRTGSPVEAALRRVAHNRGAAFGSAVAAGTGRRPAATVAAAIGSLADLGYEPRVEGDDVFLANCPFRSLVGEHAALVCAMNEALLQGFAAALPGGPLAARLHPCDRHCCVRLEPTPTMRRN